MDTTEGETIKKVISTLSFSTILIFAGAVMAQTQDCKPKVAWNSLCSKRAKGNAVATDVLEGKTFSNKADVGINGAMVSNGAVTFRPGTVD